MADDAPKDVYDRPAPTPAVSPPRTDENVDYVPEILDEPPTPWVRPSEEDEDVEETNNGGNMVPPPVPTSRPMAPPRPPAQATQAQNSHRYRLGNPNARYRNPIPPQHFSGPSLRNPQIQFRPHHENPTPMQSAQLQLLKQRMQVLLF